MLALTLKILKDQWAKVLKIAVFDNPTGVWFKFLWWGPKTHVFRNSRSSKVVDVGTNRKCICNYLLVINSNLGPILFRCRDIAIFLLRTVTPPLFDQNFGGVPLRLDCWCWGPRSEDPKLSTCVIIFRVTQPIWPQYLNVTDRQTDG